MLRSAFLRKLSAITGTAIIAPSAFITQENTKFINSDSLNEPAKQVREFSKKIDNMSSAGFHYTHLPQVRMDSCNH